MAATLTWLDHNAADRDRMNRILALFRERDTRDELGIGGIRDLIADELFPGTSTIQTRLRYMLFVPWVYQKVEQKRRGQDTFAQEARKLEVAIVKALIAGDGDTAGVFGKRAGGGLKRLPSSVYWAGLGSWGIRRFQGSQDQYHARIEELLDLRDRRHHSQAVAKRRGESYDIPYEDASLTWHPKLPPPPEDFPEVASVHLLPEEARFIQDQVTTSHPDSLLAHVIALPLPDVAYPWEHPAFAEFAPAHRQLLHHASVFSDVMHGAAILYNLMLAEVQGSAELADARRDDGAKWITALDPAAISGWSPDWVLPLAMSHAHGISPRTLGFCRDWLDLVRVHREAVFSNPAARSLIRAREMRLKLGRSRFTNQRALDQWGGEAGLARLNFRWPTVWQFVSDLQAGLKGVADA